MHKEIETLRKLAELSSKEASLRLKIYEKFTEAKNEVIRLGGMIAFCERIDPEKAQKLRKTYLILFEKYVANKEY
ncbi:MAG: hypothetical protein RQ952_05950 [Thermoproteota archaeon]|jgi:hypothetical protein|nr:hypothetical protein [Thermoproteota archaeon]